MEPQDYPLVIRQAVTPEFRAYVNELIQNQMDNFTANPAGQNRRMLKMDYVTPEGDTTLFEAKQKLAKHFGINEYVVPPNLKDFISYITEGGFIHPHTDPDLPGKRHVRINVLVKQPGGCIPMLEDVPLAVSEGDAWLNLASQCEHSTTPVVGPGYRSAVSFGYQIDPDLADEFFAVHTAWMEKVRRRVA